MKLPASVRTRIRSASRQENPSFVNVAPIAVRKRIGKRMIASPKSMSSPKRKRSIKGEKGLKTTRSIRKSSPRI